MFSEEWADDEELDALVQRGLEARRRNDVTKWELGDLALKVDTRWGERCLQEYARAIGVEYGTLANYRWIAAAFPPAARTCDLSWSCYRASLKAEHPDRPPEWWLREAEAKGWGANRLRDRIINYEIFTERGGTSSPAVEEEVERRKRAELDYQTGVSPTRAAVKGWLRYLDKLEDCDFFELKNDGSFLRNIQRGFNVLERMKGVVEGTVAETRPGPDDNDDDDDWDFN